jgi:hypothetical protein
MNFYLIGGAVIAVIALLSQKKKEGVVSQTPNKINTGYGASNWIAPVRFEPEVYIHPPEIASEIIGSGGTVDVTGVISSEKVNGIVGGIEKVNGIVGGIVNQGGKAEDYFNQITPKAIYSKSYLRVR